MVHKISSTKKPMLKWQLQKEFCLLKKQFLSRTLWQEILQFFSGYPAGICRVSKGMRVRRSIPMSCYILANKKK